MPITVLRTDADAVAGTLLGLVFFDGGAPAANILLITVQIVDSSPTDRVVESVELLDTEWAWVQDLIHIPELDKDDGEDFRTETWYALNTPALEDTRFPPEVKVHMIGKCTDITTAAIFLNGVDTDNPIEATQIGNGSNTPPTITINTITANAYVIDSLVSGESDGTKITAVHTPIHVTDVGADTTGSQYVDAGDSGAQIMNYGDVDSDTPWVMSAIAIKAFAPPVGGKSFGFII